MSETTPRLATVLSQVAPTRGAARALRGAALAGTAATLSVAAHATAGGALPDLGTTALITALLAGVWTALADRERGTAVIISALGISQLVLHFLLELTAHHQHGAANTGFDPGTMLLGHIAAAALAGLLLSRAERALFVIARLLGRFLPRKPAALPIRIARPTIRSRTPFQALAEFIYQRIHALRGPPMISEDPRTIPRESLPFRH